MRIKVVDPGYTATDLNANRGTQTIGEGAEIIVRTAQIGPDGPTGAYLDRHGPRPLVTGSLARPAPERVPR